MSSASGISKWSTTRVGSRYSIVTNVPRRFVDSSMSGPMYWLGVTTLSLTQGSSIVSMSVGFGSRAGLSTTTTPRPCVRLTWYSTDGAEAMRSRSNSRSRRSWTISMWRRPRNPQRNPNPSATELSGS